MADDTEPAPRRGQPRSAADAAALHRFDGAMALPLVLAAVLPLVLVPGSQRNGLAVAVNLVAWIVFVIDLTVHQRRLVRYLSTWVGRFDLTVVVLTAPWFLIVSPGDTKFVLLIRLARLGRLVMAGTGARRLFQRIGRVAIVATGVVFLGAAAAYGAEHPTNPEFASYGDSLWWAVVTLATVGYGDIVPQTVTGRLVGVMIMVMGVGVLGVLAGSLASFFRLSSADAADVAAANDADAATAAAADAAGDPSVDLRREVVELRAQIAQLSAGITALLAQRADGTDPGR